MNTIKFLYDSIDAFMISFWSISIVRIFSFVTKGDIFENIDSTITTGVGAVGLAILILKGLHTYKMNKKTEKEKDLLNESIKIENKKKLEELEALEIQNDIQLEKKTD